MPLILVLGSWYVFFLWDTNPYDPHTHSQWHPKWPSQLASLSLLLCLLFLCQDTGLLELSLWELELCGFVCGCFKLFSPLLTEAAVPFRVFLRRISSHSYILLIRRLDLHPCHLALDCSWHLPGVSPTIAVERFYFAVIMTFYSQTFFLLVGIRYAPITKRHANFRDCVLFALSSCTSHFTS